MLPDPFEPDSIFCISSSFYLLVFLYILLYYLYFTISTVIFRIRATAYCYLSDCDKIYTFAALFNKSIK